MDTTEGTLREMSRIVEREHRDPRIIARARSLVGGCQSMGYACEAQAVWDFIIDHVRYVRDPVGAEHITTPIGLDTQIDEQGFAQEDCESIALYAAALLSALGARCEWEIMGQDPARPTKFSHCALRVWEPYSKSWISFDPVGYFDAQHRGTNDFDLGDTMLKAGDPMRHYTMTGEQTLLGEAFGDDRSNLNQASGYVNQGADALSTLGPWGAIIGGLAKGGLAIADKTIPGGGGSTGSSSGSGSSSSATPKPRGPIRMTRGPAQRLTDAQLRDALAAARSNPSRNLWYIAAGLGAVALFMTWRR